MTANPERPEGRDSRAPWEHRPDCYGPTGFWSDEGCKHPTEAEWLRSRLAEKNVRIKQMEEALRPVEKDAGLILASLNQPGKEVVKAWPYAQARLFALAIRAALSPSDTEEPR